MIKSIGIVRLSALGDVLMLTPLIRTLQDYFPHSRLTWIISRPAYDFVAGLDGVEFLVIDKPRQLKDYWYLRKQLKPLNFDVLLAPQASFRTNLLYPLIKAKRKIGYDNKRANDGHKWFVNEQIASGNDHTVDGFLKFAKKLGCDTSSIRWDIPISEEDYSWAEQYCNGEQPVLIINPAASKLERSWDVEKYIAVLRHAVTHWNVKIIITGGPGELDKYFSEYIEKEIPVVNLAGKTKPKQLLALISKAQAVLCPDTGPSHMAAAVNTPVVALHAVTNPLISGPYTFQNLVVNRYPQAAAQFLNAKNIEAVWGQHVHGNQSMQLISVPEVIEKLAIIFS